MLIQLLFLIIIVKAEYSNHGHTFTGYYVDGIYIKSPHVLVQTFDKHIGLKEGFGSEMDDTLVFKAYFKKDHVSFCFVIKIKSRLRFLIDLVFFCSKVDGIGLLFDDSAQCEELIEAAK
jgi:hypothetical protein